MNRRDTLRSVMEHAGFEEFLFELLPDASLFWRVPLVRNVELAWHDFSRRTGLPFVDSCILAVYRRVDDNGVTQSL
jgi:hypothetical protein